MSKTIFQKIIDREIPAKIEHEDEHCIVLHDIQPQAPVHLLIIPKKLNLAAGFRLVINNGPQACESVPHLHVHLLAGRQMTWPPG